MTNLKKKLVTFIFGYNFFFLSFIIVFFFKWDLDYYAEARESQLKQGLQE